MIMVGVTVKFAGYCIVYPMFDMIMVTCGCCCYLLHIVYPVFDTVMVTLWALLCAGRVCGLRQSEPGSTVHGTGAAGHLQDPHRPPLSLHVSTVEFKSFFKTTLLFPCRKFGLPHLDLAAAAARGALPIPARVCGVFVHPSDGKPTNLWDF